MQIEIFDKKYTFSITLTDIVYWGNSAWPILNLDITKELFPQKIL